MNALKDKSILIVDDEPDIREILSDALEMEGAKVKACDNGREGFLASLEFKPDIILSDGLMPEMSGLDLLQQVQQSGHSCIRVLISAFGENLEEEALRREIDAVFLKPFQISSILSFLEKAINQKHRPRRKALRLRCRISVNAKFPPLIEPMQTFTSNISAGGFFVEMYAGSLPELGTSVDFELFLNDDTSAKGKGHCRWHRSVGDFLGPRGFGLQFTVTEQNLPDLVDHLIRSARDVEL